MSVEAATEFLKDIGNHSDVAGRAVEADADGLLQLAAELGHEDVTADDLTAAAEAMGDGSDDDVTAFSFGGQILSLGGLDLGGLGGLSAKGPSNSTHGPERRKWPKPECDCDAD